MKSVYIAGPYTAPTRELEDANIDQAAAKAAEYMREGWMVFCPHTMSAYLDRNFNEDKALAWSEWLKNDLHWLRFCDAIHLLPGWEDSAGARQEYDVAKGLGLEILGVEQCSNKDK